MRLGKEQVRDLIDEHFDKDGLEGCLELIPDKNDKTKIVAIGFFKQHDHDRMAKKMIGSLKEIKNPEELAEILAGLGGE